jgi:transcriptional regulator with GAF, ATPase, and Fis domain
MNNPVEQTRGINQIWLSCTNSQSGLCPQHILSSLDQAKVDTQLLSNNGKPRGPGVMVVEAVTQQVCEFISEASQNGIERILVLVEDDSALTGGEAWRLMEAGASDVLVLGDLADIVPIILARLRRWQEVDELLESPALQDNLVGVSRGWRKVLRQVVEAAHFTDSPILLMGETGTGKELLARLIHSLDRRRGQRELVIVDCTTIIPELSGSELFGHEKGAFTGAIGPREGAFALADGGTLFLDEVGELPLGLQVQLLRVLQEHTYKRVGSNIWRQTDFRLICATNRDLLLEEGQGNFRRDLYYRLASWSFRLPSLQERVDDILPLANHFVHQACDMGKPPELDERVQAYLLGREYPGNVRDLRSLVFRMISRHVGPGPVTIGDIPPEERPGNLDTVDWRDVNLDGTVRRALTMGADLRDLTHAMKKTAIRLAVEEENGNLQRAARRLGVTDRTLQLWRAEHMTHS